MLLSAWHFIGVNKTPKIKQNKTKNIKKVMLKHQAGYGLFVFDVEVCYCQNV